jgi:hypothetical protein
MNKFKVNNIFVQSGKTLDEIISNFFITFLDEELNLFDFNDIMNSDTILNN